MQYQLHGEACSHPLLNAPDDSLPLPAHNLHSQAHMSQVSRAWSSKGLHVTTCALQTAAFAGGECGMQSLHATRSGNICECSRIICVWHSCCSCSYQQPPQRPQGSVPGLHAAWTCEWACERSCIGARSCNCHDSQLPSLHEFIAFCGWSCLIDTGQEGTTVRGSLHATMHSTASKTVPSGRLQEVQKRRPLA